MEPDVGDGQKFKDDDDIGETERDGEVGDQKGESMQHAADGGPHSSDGAPDDGASSSGHRTIVR